MITPNTCTLLFILGLSLSVNFGCGNNDANNTSLPILDVSADLSLDLSNDDSKDLSLDLSHDGSTDLAEDLSNDETSDLSSGVCARNERVLNNQCQACDAGSTNEPGDDVIGTDTVCDDPCTAALGVTCADVQQAYLKASNSLVASRFGRSVAVSGDTIAVGAIGELSNATGVGGDQNDDNKSYSGAVYVFTRTNGVWSQQAYIKASNTSTGAKFGKSVALEGDTLIVGAFEEDSESTGINGNYSSEFDTRGSGAVYVFTRAGATWSQQAYIKASNTGGDDKFGTAVALSGDTIVVGALGEDSDAMGIDGSQTNDNAPRSGAVYVFTRANDIWTQQAYIKASNAGEGDQFGGAVALETDTIVVGAFGEDSDATGINGDQSNDDTPGSGSAYVFTRTNGTWTQQAYIKASNTGEEHDFGWSVALSKDTLAVGAQSESSNATGIDGDQTNTSSTGSGAVYVFTRTNAMWSQQAYIKASNTAQGDAFGVSVALEEDTLVVGAESEDSDATGVDGDQTNGSAGFSGATYMFTRINNQWNQKAYIKASNTGPADAFGKSIALSAGTLVVGAYAESSNARGVNGDQNDDSADFSGAVYVYKLAP